MAPEVAFKQEHGLVADFFSLGVIAFELIFGKRPFTSWSKDHYRKDLQNKIVILRASDMPEDFSEECANFVSRCLD